MSKFRNFAVAVVTLISATNTFGSFYLNQKALNNNTVVNDESLDTSAIEEDSNLNLENTTEASAVFSETSLASSIVSTTADSKEDDTAPVSTVVQTSTTEPVPKESKEYSIRYLTDPVSYGSDFNYHSYCVDPVKELLYYTENDKIYKIDITSGSKEEILNLKEQDEPDYQQHYIRLIYNPYDENIYAIANVNHSHVFLNISTREEYQTDLYLSFFSFSSEDSICEVYSSDAYSNVYEVKEWNFRTNSIKEGFIYKDYIWNKSGAFIFLQDDDYYWLNRKYNGNPDIKESTFYINHSRTSICQTPQDAMATESFGEIKGIARTIFNNNVFIMKSDFSVYKVDISKLKEISDNNANQDKNSVFKNDTGSVNYEDALELYISGDNIKQTGKNNITNTSNFAMTNSGRIIVFDQFDNIYKVVEK